MEGEREGASYKDGLQLQYIYRNRNRGSDSARQKGNSHGTISTTTLINLNMYASHQSSSTEHTSPKHSYLQSRKHLHFWWQSPDEDWSGCVEVSAHACGRNVDHFTGVHTDRAAASSQFGDDVVEAPVIVRFSGFTPGGGVESGEREFHHQSSSSEVEGERLGHVSIVGLQWEGRNRL